MADNIAHPDEATWDKLAAGELDPAVRDATFDHIVGCERCSRIWRGVLTLKTEAQARGLIPADAQVRSTWLQSRALPLALAATLVLAIGGVVFNRLQPNDPDASRGIAVAEVERLTTATAADGVPMFAWEPLEAATRYRVDLFTEDGRPVWTREVETAQARWPDDSPRAKGVYRWRVEALDKGVVVARSRLAKFEVTQ